MSSEQERAELKEHQIHTNALARPRNDDDTSPATLRYISEPEDIDTPVEELGWINSRSASTANLEEEDVRSKEWVLEYHQLIAPLHHPPEYGLKGAVRAWAYDDPEAYMTPLSKPHKLQTEGFTEIGKEASTRSKGGWGVETSTSDTKESIVRGNDNKKSGGGLLGKFRG